MKAVRGKWGGGGRLREFYTLLGLDRTSFAKQLDVSYDRILAYESGKTEPSPDFFQRIALHFPGTDLTWLITGSNLQDSEQDGLPILSTVRAGSLSEDLRDQDVIGYWPGSFKQEAHFALKVVGNSMHPEIQDGDIVICAPDSPFKNGSIHVVCTADSTYTIKRVFERIGGFELVPSNPEHSTVFIADSDVVRLIRVTQVTRVF